MAAGTAPLRKSLRRVRLWPGDLYRRPFHLTVLAFGPRYPRASRVKAATPRRTDSYLVDSASSHMLVSKIKPCMSKYKQLYCETANGSLNQLSFI
jgi:hypothetical protein